jgi:hypothetical protein
MSPPFSSRDGLRPSQVLGLFFACGSFGLLQAPDFFRIQGFPQMPAGKSFRESLRGSRARRSGVHEYLSHANPCGGVRVPEDVKPTATNKQESKGTDLFWIDHEDFFRQGT